MQSLHWHKWLVLIEESTRQTCAKHDKVKRSDQTRIYFFDVSLQDTNGTARNIFLKIQLDAAYLGMVKNIQRESADRVPLRWSY